jgi:hypothetical protein
MGYYVVGIGGTGAKCVEALTHLCAAGLLPDGELYTLFVDPDKANGSLERAEITLQRYTKCEQLRLGKTELFKTRVTIADPDVWSPFGKDAPPLLDAFFQYNNLAATNAGAAHMFDVLFSQDEKQTSLEKGFRGHPSIGAAVMASTLNLGTGEPWETFRSKVSEDIKTGGVAKVVLIGSIFGGTGASGLPTIARLIRDELTGESKGGANIGGVLVLPYFTFDPVKEEKLRADAENFLLSTQAALKYYYQQNDLNIYDAVYLLGDEALSPMREPSIGGKTQRNEPHFIELYAALACIDFFSANKPQGYPMIARHKSGKTEWTDLPYASGSDVLRQKIDHLARFAFAYLNTYHPMLESIDKVGQGYRAPWFINLLERKDLNLSEAMRGDLKHVKDYCEDVLRWLANIQGSARDSNVELINYLSFASKRRIKDKDVVDLLPHGEFRRSEFTSLVLPQSGKDENALTRLWEMMSESDVRDKDADGVGRFIHALYRECAKV